MKHLFYLLLSVFLSSNMIAQDSLNCSLLFHWDDEDLIGSFAYDNTYNEIWGVAQDDREYAIIGSTAGTHIFDVTNPEILAQVFFLLYAEIQKPCKMSLHYYDSFERLQSCAFWRERTRGCILFSD